MELFRDDILFKIMDLWKNQMSNNYTHHKLSLSLEIINLHVSMKDAHRAQTPDQTNNSLFLTYEHTVATPLHLCISILVDDTHLICC